MCENRFCEEQESSRGKFVNSKSRTDREGRMLALSSRRILLLRRFFAILPNPKSSYCSSLLTTEEAGAQVTFLVPLHTDW
jgi:hypothetical protein